MTSRDIQAVADQLLPNGLCSSHLEKRKGADSKTISISGAKRFYRDQILKLLLGGKLMTENDLSNQLGSKKLKARC